MIRIPFDSSSSLYKFNTAIEDVQYTFIVKWNRIDRAWYFDLLDVAEQPIAIGIKIVLGGYLGTDNTNDLFGKGAFVVVDNSGLGRNATIDDLGTRVQVWYLSALTIQGLQDGQLV